MWYNEDNFSVVIGGNKYVNVPNILVYKGDPIFRITRAERTDQLGIDFDIFDSKRNKIAIVKNGRIYKGDKERYQVDIKADQYTLTDKSNNSIICDIKKRSAAGSSELDVNVHLYMKDGFLFEASPEKTNIGGVTLKGNTIMNCANGIVIS
jgi:hypothetical protein